ncbi:hypothetical protein vseg_001560 [Gypsophila vaccaria]
MRITQSPSLFITFMLLICCAALRLQCTEGAPKVRNVLGSRLKFCKRKEENVASACRFLLNNTVQAGYTTPEYCCKKLGWAKFGQDCLCLIRESARATPSYNSSETQNETLQVLEAVTKNKHFMSSCAALDGIEDNCAGVAKALKRVAEIKETTLQEDLAMSSHCDKAALELRDVCGPTIAKAQSGSKINSKQAQTIVCCNELERFTIWRCACSLGSTVRTSKDILDFLADVSAVGDKLSAGCRSFTVNTTEFCPKPTNQGNKNPLLFDKCETTAQEAVKTCAPMIEEAIATSNKTKPISSADANTISCCDLKLVRGMPDSCFCNKTLYEEYKMSNTVGSTSATKNNPQTVSCCKQLAKLIDSPPQTCFCKITHHKSVTSRATTKDFLTSDIIHRAVDQNCGPIFYITGPCGVKPSENLNTKIDNSLWGVLGRYFTGNVPKKLCYPGMSGPRGC